MASTSEQTRLLSRREALNVGGSSYGTGQHEGGDSDPEAQKRDDVQKWTRRVLYYIPSTAWIPNYSFSLLGGDLMAGATMAAMIIPGSISYGISLAKLGPTAGLFAASIPPLVYSLLGTSRQVLISPEAALSLLVGQAVSEAKIIYPNFPDQAALGIAVATAITFQVGLFSFVLGFFRLGFLDVVLSRALMRGFLSAIAVVITVEQFIPMFGLVPLEQELNPPGTLDKIVFFVTYVWDNAHKPTMAVSFGTLAVLVVLRAIKGHAAKTKLDFITRLPEVLVVVVLSTYLSAKYRWDELGVEILGAVPIRTGGNFFQFPFQSTSRRVLTGTTSTAILITIIGFLDSIIAAKAMGEKYVHPISPNRELVALGASNLAGSFVPGTLPAFGSIVRSRINGECGARTPMASAFCAVVILLATFYLLPWLYFLPKCVLAAIICVFITSLFTEIPGELKFYWNIRAWTDLGMLFLTFFLSVIWDVEIGIVVSLVISLLLVVNRSSKTRLTILGRIPGTDQWQAISDNPEAEDLPGILIVRIKESLDFANTAQLKERLRRIESYGIARTHPSEEPTRPPASALVFHMGDVETIDASAIQTFQELLETYQTRGLGLYIAHLRPEPRELFEKAGIYKLLGPAAFYETVGEAMAALENERPWAHVM
ncbi:sulfate anion transporter [Coniophora puteana RWD-64-598 SS2]|uniref:Sulfate anion transporter n=1 Tax=Coniophora puteana (strain RWD-64-598) TaxID=741705 RepID=A0A5M3MMT8_CONPW|nr:sulfate anion transporter [Coniophora puteana RWD-64-598 SS2]EIW80488.1 sulfate anion transporter [Coniophora puteana RWD-64-598 SS2]